MFFHEGTVICSGWVHSKDPKQDPFLSCLIFVFCNGACRLHPKLPVSMIKIEYSQWIASFYIDSQEEDFWDPLLFIVCNTANSFSKKRAFLCRFIRFTISIRTK